MTIRFDSVEQAIMMGCYYATGKFEKTPDLKEIGDGIITQFGQPINMMMYELTNYRGERVQFGVSLAGSEFHLWKIGKDGSALRV